MKLYYINDFVPARTTDLMKQACAQRNVEFIEIHAPSFDYLPEQQLLGDGTEMIYRPAVSLTAQRVEQFMYSAGVGTFYRDPVKICFGCHNPTLQFHRNDLPIPRTVYACTTDREQLRRHVSNLGGFPVVVKAPGFSSGLGVMRVDSFPSLFSLIDFAMSKGTLPMLIAYVPNAVHWRLTVVGDKVIAAYQNVTEADDFRTYATLDKNLFTLAPNPVMADIAIRAVHCQGVALGGVDILAHASGRYYLLEANYPCYFATAQDAIGVDISGAMVDYLLSRVR